MANQEDFSQKISSTLPPLCWASCLFAYIESSQMSMTGLRNGDTVAVRHIEGWKAASVGFSQAFLSLSISLQINDTQCAQSASCYFGLCEPGETRTVDIC